MQGYSHSIEGFVRQLNGAVDSFVGVVVPQSDLQLHRLKELALLTVVDDLRDGLLQKLRVYFAHQICDK